MSTPYYGRLASVIDTQNMMQLSFLPYTSRASATTTGNVTFLDGNGNPRGGGLHYPGARTLHTLVVTITGGTSPSFSLTVGGSDDNVNFYSLTPQGGSSPTIGAAGVFIFEGSFKSLQLNVSAISGGPTLSFTMTSAKSA